MGVMLGMALVQVMNLGLTFVMVDQKVYMEVGQAMAAVAATTLWQVDFPKHFLGVAFRCYFAQS